MFTFDEKIVEPRILGLNNATVTTVNNPMEELAGIGATYETQSVKPGETIQIPTMEYLSDSSKIAKIKLIKRQGQQNPSTAVLVARGASEKTLEPKYVELSIFRKRIVKDPATPIREFVNSLASDGIDVQAMSNDLELLKAVAGKTFIVSSTPVEAFDFVYDRAANRYTSETRLIRYYPISLKK